MAWSIGVDNPFLRSPGPGAAETAARGAFYGAKIRTGAIAGGKASSEPKLYWVYGKKTWANCNGLGFPPGKLNNTTTGLLSLYSPRSNLPLMPVLTGVDTSNEGAMGSVIKATVSFTMYPSLTESGVAIERIQSSFFKPGANVSCRFGWSAYAAVACASQFGFSGKVVSFSWSVNTDVSISASTSVIAPGAIATGVSANMQAASPGAAYEAKTGADGAAKAANANENGGETSPESPLDAKQVPVPAADLGTAIDNAMAEFNPIQKSGLGENGSGTSNGNGNVNTTPAGGAKEEIYGIAAWKAEGGGMRHNLRFCAVGIPWQPEPPETDEITAADEAYAADVTGGGDEEEEVTDEQKKKEKELKDIEDKMKKLNSGTAGEKPKPIVKKFWYVQFASMENYLSPLLGGATNGEIQKVDIANKTDGYPGPKGYISAYPMEVIWPESDYGGGPVNVAKSIQNSPIGSIWFNTDFMKETWRKYFNETSNKTSQKKLTQFLSELGKRANEAAGDYWQLSCTVVEKFSSCGSIGGRTSVLSVEDFSYCPNVGAFNFNASYGRPMLKNVSVSCKSSSTMGAAVMAGGNVDTPGKAGVTWGSPGDFIGKLKTAATENGINTAWGDAMKAVLKLKKKADAAHHSKTNILFPIDFSVSIDGCSGWQFNEAVNTNVKPPGYGGSKFAISGISNKIDASTWETSLNAMMRA